MYDRCNLHQSIPAYAVSTPDSLQTLSLEVICERLENICPKVTAEEIPTAAEESCSPREKQTSLSFPTNEVKTCDIITYS